MTGDEKDQDGYPALGTPYEDISSIVAVNNTQAKNKFLYCLGYNIDKYHGVTNESYLMNVSNLIKQDYFIGSYMLNKKDESTQKYIDVFMNCDPENSIVNSCIICSIQGHYGNYHPEWLKHRLGDSKLDIHPLMALYWLFDLDGVYKNLKYDVNKLKETDDEYQISKLLKIY